jgi:uncharacterized protein
VKLLCISDIEMPQLENAANLRRQYNDIDLIVSCGDLAPAYLDFITTIIGAPLFYVSGNHDEKYDADPPGGVDLHRQVVTHRGLTFAGLEGSIRYNKGRIQYTQAEIHMLVVRMGPKIAMNRVRYGHGIDIFVTHSPARNIHDGEDYPHRGFDGLLNFMKWYRPRYMLHGHVHTWDRRKTVRTQFEDTSIMNINPFTVLEIDPVE